MYSPLFFALFLLFLSPSVSVSASSYDYTNAPLFLRNLSFPYSLYQPCSRGSFNLDYLGRGHLPPDDANGGSRTYSTASLASLERQSLISDSVLSSGYSFTSLSLLTIKSLETVSFFSWRWSSARSWSTANCSSPHPPDSPLASITLIDFSNATMLLTAQVSSPSVLPRIRISSPPAGSVPLDSSASFPTSQSAFQTLQFSNSFDRAQIPLTFADYRLSNDESADAAVSFGSSALAVRWDCVDSGPVSVLLEFHLMLPDLYSMQLFESYSIRIEKTCSATETCEGQCVHGTCNAQRNECECEANFQFDSLCSYGIWTSKQEVCLGEQFSVHYRSEPRRGLSLFDWIGLMGPHPADLLPVNPQNLIAAYVKELTIAWIYLTDLQITVAEDRNGALPVYAGSWPLWSLYDTSGTLSFSYWPADSVTEVFMFTSITQLPNSHARCQQLRANNSQIYSEKYSQFRSSLASLYGASSTAIPLASDLTDYFVYPGVPIVLWNADSSASLAPQSADAYSSQYPCYNGRFSDDPDTPRCNCFTGYYGLQCEFGQQPVRYLNNFGLSLSTSVPGFPLAYNNLVTHEWFVAPNPNETYSRLLHGVSLQIQSLAIKDSDSFQIFGGFLNTPDDQLQLAGSFSSAIVGSFALQLNYTRLRILFRSTTLHPSLPANTVRGVRFGYRFLGCPAGYIIVQKPGITDYASLATGTVSSCVPCPSGYFSPRPDTIADSCIPCPSQTYSDSPGSSRCTSVALGFFQDSPGSKVSKSCRDSDYPSPWCPNPPFLLQASFSAFSAFVALFWLVSLLTMVALFRWSRAAIIYQSSPQFLRLALLGLLIFSCGLFISTLPSTAELCHAQYFLYHLGFTLFLNSLLCKEYRLSAIFNNKVLKSVKINNWHNWTYISVCILIDFALFLPIWAAAPYQVATQEFPVCEASKPLGRYLLWALAAWKTLQSLGLLVLCWQLRSIPKPYNESTQVASCLALCWVIGIVLCVVYYAFSPDEYTRILIQSALLLIGLFSLFFLLYSVKLFKLFRGIFLNSDSSSDSWTKTMTQNNPSMKSSDGGEQDGSAVKWALKVQQSANHSPAASQLADSNPATHTDGSHTNGETTLVTALVPPRASPAVAPAPDPSALPVSSSTPALSASPSPAPSPLGMQQGRTRPAPSVSSPMKGARFSTLHTAAPLGSASIEEEASGAHEEITDLKDVDKVNARWLAARADLAKQQKQLAALKMGVMEKEGLIEAIQAKIMKLAFRFEYLSDKKNKLY